MTDEARPLHAVVKLHKDGEKDEPLDIDVDVSVTCNCGNKSTARRNNPERARSD